MEYWQIYGAALATVISVWGIVWKMTADLKKEGSAKRDMIWRRYDEYKKHLEETHVSKEVCGILHKQICEDIVEIKADVKKLLIMVKNGHDK